MLNIYDNILDFDGKVGNEAQEIINKISDLSYYDELELSEFIENKLSQNYANISINEIEDFLLKNKEEIIKYISELI